MKLIILLFAICTVAVATNEAGKKFLEENKAKEGVVTLPSGLQYKVLRKGSGAHHPTKDSPCECHYEGTLVVALARRVLGGVVGARALPQNLVLEAGWQRHDALL